MSATINTTGKLSRTILWVIFLLYMGVLTKFIIFKRHIGSLKQHFEGLYHHYNMKSNIDNGNLNLRPFHTIDFYMNSRLPIKYAILNLVGNIAGFVVLGVFIPLLIYRLRSAAATIFAVFLISLSFEIMQLFGMLGVCDIDDLILNTLGGAIGYGIYLLLRKLLLFNKEYPYLYQKNDQ